MQELEKIQIPDPEANVELKHPPIEVDPVADFEIARAAMEAQMKQLNAELAEERELRKETEQDRDLIRQERKLLEYKLQKTEKESERKDYDLSRYRDVIRSERRFWEKKMQKPILWPCLLIAGFAVLAMLIGVAVDHALLSHLLGEPIGYGAICACTFFGGIVWERLGGVRHGNCRKPCSH